MPGDGSSRKQPTHTKTAGTRGQDYLLSTQQALEIEPWTRQTGLKPTELTYQQQRQNSKSNQV